MDKLQYKNKEWWTKNPMTYDWQRTIPYEEGTKEFFKTIDERFFEIMRLFAHPDYPKKPPFYKLIDYSKLKGKRVLEVGCGIGSIAAELSKGANLTAIDITKKAIELARKRFELFKLKGTIIIADAEKMPFENESFDFVWSWGVIHHSANAQKAIDEIYRVLKPGGIAKIMVYHRNSFRYWVVGGIIHGILKGKLFRMSLEEVNKSFTDGYIARSYTKKDIKRMFRRFKKIDFRAMDQKSSFFSFMPENLYKLFMSRFGWFAFIEVEK